MVTQSSPSIESLLVPSGRRCLRAGVRRLANWASIGREYHIPSLSWRLGRLLIASSKDHAFLDRGWISPVMRLTPERLRARWPCGCFLSARITGSISGRTAIPLIARASKSWPPNTSGMRPHGNSSATTSCGPYLRPEMTVLDFGCGPGFLAKAVACVSRVIATDVSRGVIACAQQINAADNLRYVVNGLSDLENVDTSSINFVYSFAVFQHLTKDQSLAFFQEFARVLKPGTTGLCHVILKEPHGATRVIRTPATG